MELGINYQKKINFLLSEITELFYNNSYKLPLFIFDMCNNEKIVWFKNEPFNFVRGNETIIVPAKNEYSSSYITDNISIGNSIYNPYDVFCVCRTQHRTFYDDKNIAFIYGNIALHWSARHDKITLYVKNKNENFSLDNLFYPQTEFKKSTCTHRYNNDDDITYTDKRYNKEIYHFLLVIHNEFKKYTQN